MVTSLPATPKRFLLNAVITLWKCLVMGDLPHRQGSFTGINKDKVGCRVGGWLSLAHGGVYL